MKRLVIISLLAVLSLAGAADAARVRRVVVRGPRRTVVVRTGFPIHRVLPAVVVRPVPAFRVVPRVYLAPVVFGAAVVALPAVTDWRQSEMLDREDGWTDFTMNVDRRGSNLLLQIDRVRRRRIDEVAILRKFPGDLFQRLRSRGLQRGDLGLCRPEGFFFAFGRRQCQQIIQRGDSRADLLFAVLRRTHQFCQFGIVSCRAGG